MKSPPFLTQVSCPPPSPPPFLFFHTSVLEGSPFQLSTSHSHITCFGSYSLTPQSTLSSTTRPAPLPIYLVTSVLDCQSCSTPDRQTYNLSPQVHTFACMLTVACPTSSDSDSQLQRSLLLQPWKTSVGCGTCLLDQHQQIYSWN